MNLDSEAGQQAAQTSTDTNGYYGFDAPPGRYVVEFVRPANLMFVPPDLTDDARDSDADPVTGRASVDLMTEDLTIDAGLFTSNGAGTETVPAGELPLAQVGPIRSGRLIYRHLARYFQDSCLIFAYASPEVLERLPQCAVVFHQIQGGGYMLDLSELWSVAKQNQRRSHTELDYSGYDFGETPAPGGHPGHPASRVLFLSESVGLVLRSI